MEMEWAEDLQRSAKTFMYPTNVVSTRTVTDHQQMVVKHLLTPLSAAQRRMNASLPQSVEKYLGLAWAASTQESRAHLWQKFAQFRRERGPVESMDRSAALFIAQKEGIQENSRQTYARMLSAA